MVKGKHQSQVSVKTEASEVLYILHVNFLKWLTSELGRSDSKYSRGFQSMAPVCHL